MSSSTAQLLPMLDILVRLGASVLAGGALGINRELLHKPAGIRTHAMVALGAAALVLVASESAMSEATPDVNALSRVIQGIVTGIGFVGAGTILRAEREQTVHGLTTAASIWVCASIGIACGAGHWHVATLAVALAWAVLSGGHLIERWFARWFGKPGYPPGKDQVLGEESGP